MACTERPGKANARPPSAVWATDRPGHAVGRETAGVGQAAVASGFVRPAGALALTDDVREVTVDLEPRAHARWVDLGLLPSADLSIVGDVDGIRVLLRNRIDNAIKHTPGDGSINVSAQQSVDGISLIVEDSPPRIPPQARVRVFDRFFRLPGRAAEGSELGLGIANEVVDMHRTHIELDRSERLGELRVAVVFPVELVQDDGRDEPTRGWNPPALSRS